MTKKDTTGSAPQFYRFGPYELDLPRSELRKFGVRLKVAPRVLQLLAALLEHSGEVVTRSQLRKLLWDEGVFVDFEKGLTVAVTKLRAVLNDSPDNPRYIATVAGEGYRFIGMAVEHERRPAPHVSGSMLPKETNGQSGSATLGESPPIFSNSDVRPHFTSRRRSVHLLAAFAAIVGIGILSFAALRGSRQNRPSDNLGPQYWVVVAEFENQTGEPTLDSIPSYVMKAELSNSRFVRIVPGDKIQEILQMMRRLPDTRIDAAIGREVCLRDGQVKALITGRISKIGSRFLVTALIVDPASGVIVKGFTEEAADQVELLHSIRQLSNSVRKQLGETLPLIHQDPNQLEPVTTASLHALQLYSAAGHESEYSQVDELLSGALREDPKFASAYIDLAWASLNRDKPKQIWLPAARRAFELTDNLPDKERYFVRGSYFQMVGNKAEAISAYESLLQLDGHQLDALEHLYQLTHQKELLYRLADAYTDSFEWNRRAWTKANAEGDAPAEQRYGARAQQLATPANLETTPDPAEAAVKLAGAYRYLQRGDLGRAQAEAERVSLGFNLLGPRGKISLAIAEGNFYLFLGKLQNAESWYERTDPVSKRFYSVVLAEARGAPFSSSLVRVWDEDGTSCVFDPELAVKLARAGDLTLARKLAGPDEVAFDAARAGLSDYSSLSQGTIELYRGNLRRAIPLLKRANSDLRAGPSIDERIVGTRLMAVDALASALEKAGDIRGAVDVLEPFEADPIFDPEDVLGSPAEVRFHLARLYKKLGRIAEAKRIDSELRALFAEADPDYQLARLLNR